MIPSICNHFIQKRFYAFKKAVPVFHVDLVMKVNIYLGNGKGK